MRIAVLASVIIAAASAAAQVQETVNVNVVEVPVTVLDRAGEPLRGLTAANFELYEVGKRRELSAFDRIDFASPESVRMTSRLNPAAHRYFMLLFDLSYSSPTSITRAQQAARDFIKRTMQDRDRVAIATIDVQRGYRLLTAFTTDRLLLSQAIADPRTFTGSDPLQIAGTSPLTLNDVTQMTANDSARGEKADQLADIIRQQDRLDDLYNRGKIDRQINLLSGLAKILRSVQGRKHVILLSEGFDPRLIQGRDAHLDNQQVEESFAVERGEVWKVDSDNRYGSATSLSMLRQMVNMFSRSDVVLQAVDIRGLRVQTDVKTGERAQSNEGLFLLSQSTGGDVFRNNNDLRGDFDRLMRQQEVVYVLAFRGPAANAGKYHDLKVKLVNVNVRGARPIHRSGYYEAGAENPLERSLSNAEIILNDIPQNDIHVASLATPFPTNSARAQVPVILEAAGDDIIAAAKDGRATVEIFTYAFDDGGIARDTLFQRLTLDMAKVEPMLRASGLKYYATLSLPEGNYAVKSLVRIVESDRKGYARSDIVVTPPSDVALSPPLFFEAAGRWLMIKGGSHDATNAKYPFEVNGESFIPCAAVRARDGEPRKFALFVYNASPDEMSWEITPAATLVSKMMNGDSGVMKLVFEMPKLEGASEVGVTLHKKGS
ncbi:MAG: VWA domain-containing protein, partial [Thermoanaerobaculia bacterium]